MLTMQSTRFAVAVLAAALSLLAASEQSAPAQADWINALRQGGYVIVFRHGATHQDQADTDPLNPSNVSQQRQLNDAGRAKAKEIGEAFRKLRIPVGQVQTSVFNRAVETGTLMNLGEVTSSLDFTEGDLVVTPTENNRRAQALRQLATTRAARRHQYRRRHPQAQHPRCLRQGLVRCAGRRGLRVPARWRRLQVDRPRPARRVEQAGAGGAPNCERSWQDHDLFLRSRISANTFQAGLPASPTDFATSGTSARRNGFAAFSAPMIEGMVGSAAARSASTSRSRAASAALRGSIVLAKRMLACRVFVAAVDARIVGQAAQLEQRLPHHFRRALDDAAAADREQRVADEGELVGREEIADVAGGVARRLKHASLKGTDLTVVALAHGRVDERNARGLAVRGHHAAAVALLELGDAAGVVARGDG